MSAKMKQLFFQNMLKQQQETATRKRQLEAGQRAQDIIGSPFQSEVQQNIPDPASPFGLMNVETTQEEQPATGLMRGQSRETQLRMDTAGQLIGTGDEQSMKQGFNMLDEIEKSATGGSGEPMTVKEWKYYSALEPKEKQEYINMKRTNAQIIDVNGVPTIVNPQQIAGGGAAPQALTTLENEAAAQRDLAAATQEGKSSIISEYKRIDDTRANKSNREVGEAKAQKFYDLLESGKMASGGMRKVLSWIPFTFTEQGQMDEEFNAFAETAARQALKASGEIRPTDADVKGMKQAMFGIGRDEKVNMVLLKDFIGSIEKNNHEAYLLAQAQKYRTGKNKDTKSQKMTKEEYEAKKARVLGGG